MLRIRIVISAPQRWALVLWLCLASRLVCCGSDDALGLSEACRAWSLIMTSAPLRSAIVLWLHNRDFSAAASYSARVCSPPWPLGSSAVALMVTLAAFQACLLRFWIMTGDHDFLPPRLCARLLWLSSWIWPLGSCAAALKMTLASRSLSELDRS